MLTFVGSLCKTKTLKLDCKCSCASTARSGQHLLPLALGAAVLFSPLVSWQKHLQIAGKPTSQAKPTAQTDSITRNISIMHLISGALCIFAAPCGLQSSLPTDKLSWLQTHKLSS